MTQPAYPSTIDRAYTDHRFLMDLSEEAVKAKRSKQRMLADIETEILDLERQREAVDGEADDLCSIELTALDEAMMLSDEIDRLTQRDGRNTYGGDHD